jgi:regulator of protease activity HflC (stomatin/prohibitin superfamily)
VAGVLLGIAVPAFFWFVILSVSTRWIMSVSKGFDIPFRKAFRFVAARTFGTAQPVIGVENGEVVFENPKGMLSALGGPGMLVVRPGNAVVLEQGGKTSRIVGPGAHALKPFEAIKKPVDAKGVVDLRPQGASDTVTNLLTKDGIPLEMLVSTGFQIEPKEETDKRPASHYHGGEATTPVHGEPEFPVYEATIQKAIFKTPPNGWKSMFPGGPVSVLRDVVASYMFDQFFSPPSTRNPNPDPDQRTIKAIEDQVKARFNPAGSGVLFRSFDIKEVKVPDDVRERMLKRWTMPVDLEIKVQEAQTERDAMIARSEGRAQSIERLEGIRLVAYDRMIEVIRKLVSILPPMDREQAVSGFISVVQQLTGRIGQDESVTMRYIEAMQAVVQSDGPKSFVFTAPFSLSEGAPQPPHPQLPQGPKGGEQEKSSQEKA